MGLAALLDFICLGIGRLDLLATVGLSRDPGLSDGGEPDISPLALQPAERHSKGKRCYWNLSVPTSSAEGQRDLGHTSCGPLHFPQPPQGDG